LARSVWPQRTSASGPRGIISLTILRQGASSRCCPTIPPDRPRSWRSTLGTGSFRGAYAYSSTGCLRSRSLP